VLCAGEQHRTMPYCRASLFTRVKSRTIRLGAVPGRDDPVKYADWLRVGETLAAIGSATGRRGAWISRQASAASHGSDSERVGDPWNRSWLSTPDSPSHGRGADGSGATPPADWTLERATLDMHQALSLKPMVIGGGVRVVRVCGQVRYSPLRGDGASDFGP